MMQTCEETVNNSNYYASLVDSQVWQYILWGTLYRQYADFSPGDATEIGLSLQISVDFASYKKVSCNFCVLLNARKAMMNDRP